jgi:hypothetical protein
MAGSAKTGKGAATRVDSNGRPETNGAAAPREAVRKQGGNGNGNGRPDTAGRSARLIATDLAGTMLAAASLETARHSDDVELIAGALCEKLDVTGDERDDVLIAARLHDIGKASMPRGVLEKSGPLEPEEWELMRQHTVIGEQILAGVKELSGVAPLVRSSHERWDGHGYPDGLTGDEIPLGSRIIFCADAFHAVRSNRPYRPGRSADEALAEVKRNAGTQFDPQVVVAFEDVVRELRIAPPMRRPAPRSGRLIALLMALVLGTAGTAVARSDLLGEPAPTGPSATSATPASPPTCPALRCTSVFGPSVAAQGAPSEEKHRRGGEGEDETGTQSAFQTEAGGQSQGSGRTGSRSKSRGTGSGRRNRTGGGNPRANPGSWAGGGSPGNSANAPGHDPNGAGNSENSQGHGQ